MRLKMGLLIVFIGMMFTTAFGHTTEPIQKQKTVFVVAAPLQVTETVNVFVSTFVFSKFGEKEIIISNHAAITVNTKDVDDVGWNYKRYDVYKLQKASLSFAVPVKYKRAPRDGLSC